MSRAKHAIAWLSVSVGFWGEGEKFTAVKEKAALDLERETEREHHCETEWKVTKLILALLPFNNCLKPKLCLKRTKKWKCTYYRALMCMKCLSTRLLFSLHQWLILLSSLCSCACSYFLLDCKHKHFSMPVCFCVSAWTVCLCLCVLPSVRRCSVPQAVTSSRPSDYCCLLHWQINPVNNYNPSPSLSLFPPPPSFQS